jgi:hypothetical protein
VTTTLREWGEPYGLPLEVFNLGHPEDSVGTDKNSCWSTNRIVRTWAEESWMAFYISLSQKLSSYQRAPFTRPHNSHLIFIHRTRDDLHFVCGFFCNASIRSIKYPFASKATVIMSIMMSWCCIYWSSFITKFEIALSSLLSATLSAIFSQQSRAYCQRRHPSRAALFTNLVCAAHSFVTVK